VRQAERDAGKRPGLTTDERVELKWLQRENFELKRANEILKKASAYFAQAELACTAGCRAAGHHPSRLERAPPGVWAAQGLAADGP
jgi:transposase-like protein